MKEGIKKCELVLSGLRMLDNNTKRLPVFIETAYSHAEDSGFNKEIINDSFLLQLLLEPELNRIVCFEFLATTLLVDAARYATRLEDPVNFSWERFFTWYGSLGLNG